MIPRRTPLKRSQKPLKRTPLARSTKPIPKRRKTPRRGSAVKDEDYCEWIRGFPCLACFARLYRIGLTEDPRWPSILAVTGGIQSECAHIGFSTSLRGLNQKYPDRETAPLCNHHHTGGNECIHKVGPEALFASIGIDRDALLTWLQKVYDAR